MPNEHRIQISLAGNIRLEIDGREIGIRGGRHRALLAILAAADRHKKTREHLKATLWPRSDETQAAGSLRTALTALRRQVGQKHTLLGADRTYVWLNGIAEAVIMPTGNEVFFEDAPTTIGTEFDDWLQTERSGRFGQVLHASGDLQSTGGKPCIGILPVRHKVDDPHCALLASRILDYVVEGLRSYEVVELFDFRRSDPAIDEAGIASIPDPRMLVELEVIKVGALAQLSVCVFSARSRRLLWNRSIAADQSGPFLFTPTEAVDFANHAIDAILVACFRQEEVTHNRPSNAPSSMIGVLHKLFGMSSTGQHQIRNYLSTRTNLEGSAMSHACYALSIANTLGEETALAADLEQAREHAVRARELDPQNALVLALIGHVYGFALREIELGAELEALARKAAPNLAICWDFSAMSAVYRGDLRDARNFGQIASRLGQFSPYRSLFQSSMAIVSTLSGDHETAVRISQSVLSRMPDFLGVMRHCTASLASLGRHEDALRMIQRIREHDPKFAADGILDPAYPLPSSASRETIRNTFQTLGVGN